jgi:branched-chain amino acid transport system permease protein
MHCICWRSGSFAIALGFALVAWLLGDSFYLRLATEALIYGLLALSVDILLGYTGLLTLGQALYFGLGAYTSALVLKHVTPSFWAGDRVSLLISAVAGLIGGYIAIRARGVYFALITFGLAQVVAKVIYNTRALGASDGIIGIPVIDIDFLLFLVNAGDPPAFFLLLLVVTVGLYFGLSFLMDTPFGRVLAAIARTRSACRFSATPGRARCRARGTRPLAERHLRGTPATS